MAAAITSLPSLSPSSSNSSSSLRSSFICPCSFLRNHSAPYGNGRRPSGRKCVSQIAVPKLAEALHSGMGAGMEESVVRLHHGLLKNAVELGLPLPVDGNALAYWAAAVPVVLWYTLATPGSVAGLVDLLYAPIHARSFRSFSADEVEIGRQMGEGSFGIVHEGYIGKGKKKQWKKEALHVVLKKVKARVKGALEMRDAEIHMNQRLQRTAPGACAEFLGTVDVSSSQSHSKLSEGVWLVWQFQGERTLDYYMKQKNFPENIAEEVLGKKGKKERGASNHKRNEAVIRKVVEQILSSLHAIHRSGVVHRDVKPLNLVLSQDSGSFKLIDLGACVDLRSGFNYVPDETVIDPTYAAPEHYVMPTCTPALPPDPFCSIVSPFVWLLNTPDRFDLFSAGLILMQLSVKQLRHDVGLQSFNSELKRVGYDLDVWRKKCHISDGEFTLLDADGGAGWELAKAMLQPRYDKDFFIWPSLGSSRPSAAAALRHRFFQGSSFPQGVVLPDLWPDFPTLPEAQFQVPVFGASVVRAALSQPSNLQKLAAEVDLGRMGSTLGAAMPTAATGSLALATGWMILAGLRNSTQVTYEMGQSMMESMGISASVFLAFFLAIKPWLEQQAAASLDEDGDLRLSKGIDQMDQLALAAVDTGASSTDRRVQEILASRHRQPGTQRLKTGLTEAVQAMEAQLASLEASISSERQFSLQQQELLVRMEKLLIQPPPREIYPAINNNTGVPNSSNGALMGKPFSEYIS